MPIPRKALLGVAIALLLAPSLFSPAASTRSGDPCEDLQRVQGIGLACLRSPGLYEVFDDVGRSLGFTHGPDPACDDRTCAASASSPDDCGVECAGPPAVALAEGGILCVDGVAGDRYVRVIYARASNDIDRYDAFLPDLRSLVLGSAQMIDDAAIATNDRLSLRVRCVDGAIAVDRVTLPTPTESADFSTIVSELRALGYTDPRQKYWVFYDDATTCPCLGIAHTYLDERDIDDNANNGPDASEPMFAVVFNAEAVRPMLHELAHTLGAVQDGAPASTLASHCYDGRDTMCYNDGGPRGGLYSVNVCPVEVFDCNKNTYCNAYPRAGSWLSNHWQVCSRKSRYLVYPANEPPVIEALVCDPAPSYPEETVSCTFRASDPAPNVTYRIDWGDGRIDNVPPMEPGVDVILQHGFQAPGTYPVTVTATDVGHPPLTSAPYAVDHTVLPPNMAPVVSAIDCTPASPQEDEEVSCALSASDEHNVSYAIDWGDGTLARVPPVGFSPPGSVVIARHAYTIGGSYTLRASATDDGRPPRAGPVTTHALSIVDDNEAPRMIDLSCSTTRPFPAQRVQCDFTALDDSRSIRYVVDWGDGATNETGPVPPGTELNATHAYADEGFRAVAVVAIDDGSPILTSPPRTITMDVDLDQEPPVLQVDRPRRGAIYDGCDEIFFDATANTTPVFLNRGCVRVAADDDGSGVAWVEVRYHGQVITGRKPSTITLLMEFPIPRFEQDLEITVRAIDGKGNARSSKLLAHAFDLS